MHLISSNNKTVLFRQMTKTSRVRYAQKGDIFGIFSSSLNNTRLDII